MPEPCERGWREESGEAEKEYWIERAEPWSRHEGHGNCTSFGRAAAVAREKSWRRGGRGGRKWEPTQVRVSRGPGRMVGEGRTCIEEREQETGLAEKKRSRGLTRGWRKGARGWGKSKRPRSVVGVGPRLRLKLSCVLFVIVISAPPKAPGRSGHGWRRGAGERPPGPLAPLHIPVLPPI